MSDAFLEVDEVKRLTGRTYKSYQIAVLKTLGLPFWINACGEPIVPRSAIEGRKTEPLQKKWEMPA